jgi:diguanylate cyclase (GGDEF)-like protein
MNQGLDLLNKTNIELKLALSHFVESLPSSGPLAYQVNSIKEAFKSNDAIFTFASLVGQYTKMQRNIDDQDSKDRENDLKAFKLLLNQCADKNLSTNQANKISDLLSKISLAQPQSTIMLAAAKALEYFVNELEEIRNATNVVVSNKQITTEETDVVTNDVFLASKRLIKEVVAISKQLIQTYPNDKCISSVLYDAAKIPDGKETYYKSIELLERTTKYLVILLQQERCNTEEILNDIHANLLSAFKQTSMIDKLIGSTQSIANQVNIDMVAELKNMEVKAKTISTIADMQKHINETVCLMSDIMNNYAESQNKNHQENTQVIHNLNNEIGNATNFIKKLENQLNTAKKTNLTDELTTVGNRKGYVKAINSARNIWLESEKPLTLILIDVDKFKNINDNYGHSVGDQVLKVLVHTLKKHLRSSDYIARYGGDEFTIILPETDLNKAIQITKKIRIVVNNLKFELRKKNKTMKITCSYGISNFTNKISNTMDVFNGADEALYQAKQEGRDAIVVFSDDELINVEN